ncbi:hypothetical protein BC831DRAFT_285598 [Entophlyctis helioformis]|nr:hypothetical protein BC831DRAFT_285598 [Entophlyctis helioformis]
MDAGRYGDSWRGRRPRRQATAGHGRFLLHNGWSVGATSSACAASKATQSECTLLQGAAYLLDLDAIDYLLRRGAHPSAKDDAGRTCLEYLQLGHAKLVAADSSSSISGDNNRGISGSDGHEGNDDRQKAGGARTALIETRMAACMDRIRDAVSATAASPPP